MVTDPVCGMAVEPTGNPTTHHNGHTWWFCSTHCHDEFTVDPERFATTAGNRPGVDDDPDHEGSVEGQ
jgi:Cu+-exporting ATPase